jgi:5-methylcytosine-specific restriction endonuclease McrA
MSPARQFVARLSSRLENEKRELVQFLIELAEFESKKHALELGYPSTYDCLVRELGLTESSAYRRIAAARLLARFPQIARYLLAHRLTLMGLVALKDVLDESNVNELLERAAGLSEPDVRQLVMRMRFGEATRSETVEVSPDQLALATAPAVTMTADRVATSASDESAAAAPREEMPEALTLWVGREFREELAAVRSLLSHAVPSGKREEVLLHVLRAQRKILERRRYGSPKNARVAATPVANPAATSAETLAETPAKRDDIPAAMKREVVDRVGGCCAYIGEDGRRCCSTYQLEFQHIIPLAKGGRTTVDNLTLYCRPHNLLQAEKDFGEELIKRKRLHADAATALAHLGYKRKEAERAVGVAVLQLPRGADLGALVRECLQILLG